MAVTGGRPMACPFFAIMAELKNEQAMRGEVVRSQDQDMDTGRCEAKTTTGRDLALYPINLRLIGELTGPAAGASCVPEAGGGVDDKAPEILVRGTCKLCKQQVWNNQERLKSITDGVEDGYYIHKACHDRLNNDQVGGERPNTQM